jgi:hypothetical protein
MKYELNRFSAIRLPGENGLSQTPIKREALPSDTVFASSEGLLATYPLHTFLRIRELQKKERGSHLNTVANDLITYPERCLPFYGYLRKKEAEQPEETELCDDIRTELGKKLSKISSKQTIELMQSRKHIDGFLKLLLLDRETASKPNNLYLEDGRLAGESIFRGLVEGCQTQEQIVDLVYNIAISALSFPENERGEKALYQILSFASPILKADDPQAGRLRAASIATNDDTLAKYILLDYISSLLETIYDPEDRRLTGMNDVLMEKNSDFDQEIKKSLRNKERIAGLTEFYEARQRVDLSLANDLSLDLANYTYELGFPEKFVAQPYELRYLYARLHSRFLKSQGQIEDDIIPLAMPHDGSLRNVERPTGSTAEAAAEILKAVYNYGQSGSVKETHVIGDVMNYLRPYDIPEQKKQILSRHNEQTRNDLQKAPHIYGIHPRGDKIIIDDDNIGGIKTLLFQPGTRMTTKISLGIGRYLIPLSLDFHYHLKMADGSNLPINNEAILWWETIILTYLKKLLCDPRAIELENGRGLSSQEREFFHKKYFGMKQHRRLLPHGEKFSSEQSNRFYETYGMTLEEYNKLLNQSEESGFYTWVFPKEVYIDENTPPVTSRIPTAEVELKKTLNF